MPPWVGGMDGKDLQNEGISDDLVRLPSQGEAKPDIVFRLLKDLRLNTLSPFSCTLVYFVEFAF